MYSFEMVTVARKKCSERNQKMCLRKMKEIDVFLCALTNMCGVMNAWEGYGRKFRIRYGMPYAGCFL